MPIDTLLLSLLICGVFALFAVVLVWTDYATTQHRKNQAAKSNADPLKKAA